MKTILVFIGIISVIIVAAVIFITLGNARCSKDAFPKYFPDKKEENK